VSELVSPLEFLQSVYSDPQVPLHARVKAACSRTVCAPQAQHRRQLQRRLCESLGSDDVRARPASSDRCSAATAGRRLAPDGLQNNPAARRLILEWLAANLYVNRLRYTRWGGAMIVVDRLFGLVIIALGILSSALIVLAMI